MQTNRCKLACSPATVPEKGPCWRIKDVSLYDPQAYGPHTFFTKGFPRFLSIRGASDYKRLIYLYTLATQTLTMIKLEND
jgi:hypothetical protein